MERAAAELFLASLFVETTPERLEALRNAAKGVKHWDGLVEALEGHGVLGLFRRNVEQAGIELPPTIAPQLQARVGEQQSDDRRARLGLQRFLAAAAREGVDVTLVGGSALCFDLYPEPLRRLGEVELFVPAEHFSRALRAAEVAGLLPAEDALPVWWHRRSETALVLSPISAVLRAVRIAPVLHHPSLCLTAREHEILARRRRVSHEGHPLHLLDPLDALLELAIALAARAGESLLVSGRRHVLAAAAWSDHPVRLDQLLDLRTRIEGHHGSLPVAELVARAKEWSAEPALRAALECLQMGLGFLPGPRDWARRVAQTLANATPAGGGSPLFRPDPIERLPFWLRPSDDYLRRWNALSSTSSPRRLRLARARHVAGVLVSAAFLGLGYPVAVVGRRVVRDARRRAWNRAQAPERMSDMNDAWRTAAVRAERQKPLTPRTISLPAKEESVARFPDRYLG